MRTAAVLLLPFLLPPLLAACNPATETVEHPEGSRAVVVNQPTAIGDVRVVASQAKADEVTIDVDGSDQPDGETGGDRTTVWILPQ
jgi:hypothetical protein